MMATAAERLEAYRRMIAILAVIVVLVLSFMIIRPFLVPIISAAVLAYLFYPLYKWLVGRLPKKLPRETLSAMITCLLIVLIVLIPMISITGILTNEIRNGYIFINRVVRSPEFNLNIHLPQVLGRDLGNISISQYKQEIASFGVQVINILQNVAKAIPNVFFNIFLTIISIYFFLKGARNINDFFQDFFPLPAGRYKQIQERLDDLSRGMIMGQVVVGIIHGFLAWFAYSVLGVPNPVLWAFLTAIISIIPVLGASIVWFPVALYLFVGGLAGGSYWKGIVLFFYGLLLMSTIDNALKPKIIGDRSRIHPLVILFGILGGIQLVGLPGIIFGPLVLGLLDVVLGIWREVI
jgi:predicted PurR-regulated permease PerM